MERCSYHMSPGCDQVVSSSGWPCTAAMDWHRETSVMSFTEACEGGLI